MLKEDKYGFEKRIVYLDYYERGEKIKSGGFVKWEIRNGVCRIQLVVKGLYPSDTLGTQIEFISEKEYVPAVPFSLKYGSGEYIASFNAENMAGRGLSYHQCGGLRIKVSDNRYILGEWEQKEKRRIVEEKTVEIEEEIAVEIAEEIELPKEIELSKDVKHVQEMESEIVSLELIPTVQAEMAPKPLVLSADKWEQLHKVYPIIRPFEDNREYLSITPRDFIVFTRKYQKLVHNSFMLHGYYNYGHLVLTKVGTGGEESYFMGVPGVYYEQEKEAASMFGFEGFEAANKEVTDGGFGYYMKRVEI